MLNSGSSEAGGRVPRERPSGFKAALLFLRNRFRQAVSQDGFGEPSRVGRAIFAVVWILVFFGLWKLFDSVWTLHWLFSALGAALVASIMVRIFKRILFNGEPD